MGLILSKVQEQTAAEICARVELEAEAISLLTAELAPPDYLKLLVQKELFPDSIKFLAHGLPRREAVWWACLCIRVCPEAAASLLETEALEAAERWVRAPEDENRRTAQVAAERAPVATPSGCAAMGAFMGGGSIAPPQAPAVEPDPSNTAKFVVGAILTAVVRAEPENAREKYRTCLKLGVEVANGQSSWGTPATNPAT